MKKYVSPEVEFVEIKTQDIFTGSPGCEGNSYVCPNMYGNACGGNPYN